jgi:hypothetical protein
MVERCIRRYKLVTNDKRDLASIYSLDKRFDFRYAILNLTLALKLQDIKSERQVFTNIADVFFELL